MGLLGTGKSKDKSAPSSRYSDRDPDIRGLVLGIRGKGAEGGFRTAAFSHDDGGKTWIAWLEAVKTPQKEDWTVWQYDRVESAPGEENNRRVPVLSAACFFDALRFCGEFELAEKRQGRFSATEKIPSGRARPHFAAVAAQSGLPLDRDGLPVPAAGGDILVAGDFSDAALKTAESSPPAVPAATDPAADIKAFLDKAAENSPAMALSAKDEAALRVRSMAADRKRGDEKDRITSLFNAAAAASESAYASLEKAVNKDFRGDSYLEQRLRDRDNAYTYKTEAAVGGVFGGIFTLGIRPAVLAYGYREKLYPERIYLSRRGKFAAAVAALPESEPKRLLNEFAQGLDRACLLEKAGSCYRRCMKEGGSKLLMNKGLKLVGQAAGKFGLSADDAETLKKAYAAGKFPERGSFLRDLGRKYNPEGYSDSYYGRSSIIKKSVDAHIAKL